MSLLLPSACRMSFRGSRSPWIIPPSRSCCIVLKTQGQPNPFLSTYYARLRGILDENKHALKPGGRNIRLSHWAWRACHIFVNPVHTDDSLRCASDCEAVIRLPAKHPNGQQNTTDLRNSGTRFGVKLGGGEVDEFDRSVDISNDISRFKIGMNNSNFVKLLYRRENVSPDTRIK